MASGSYSASVRLDWYGEQLKLNVFEITKRRVRSAVIYLKERIVENISTPVERITGPRGGVITIRSKPGEYPRKDTGALIDSLESGVVILPGGIWDGYVGTPLDYGLYLEKGTRKMAPRPFLERTLFEESLVIRAMLTGPIRL